ncbi:hypothetical protein PIB30_014570 [Stylosanthes scabra]|uniref:Uncharacterized protein n=1 Tax=Stylosanthes scabra TaxID=79078 RepID=A0ABU6Z789_9FABA|nr:hypothetical protein [Stylosanthes scabra]
MCSYILSSGSRVWEPLISLPPRFSDLRVPLNMFVLQNNLFVASVAGRPYLAHFDIDKDGVEEDEDEDEVDDPNTHVQQVFAILVNHHNGRVALYQHLDACFEGIQPAMYAAARFNLVDLGMGSFVQCSLDSGAAPMEREFLRVTVHSKNVYTIKDWSIANSVASHHYLFLSSHGYLDGAFSHAIGKSMALVACFDPPMIRRHMALGEKIVGAEREFRIGTDDKKALD